MDCPSCSLPEHSRITEIVRNYLKENGSTSISNLGGVIRKSEIKISGKLLAYLQCPKSRLKVTLAGKPGNYLVELKSKRSRKKRPVNIPSPTPPPEASTPSDTENSNIFSRQDSPSATIDPSNTSQNSSTSPPSIPNTRTHDLSPTFVTHPSPKLTPSTNFNSIPPSNPTFDSFFNLPGVSTQNNPFLPQPSTLPSPSSQTEKTWKPFDIKAHILSLCSKSLKTAKFRTLEFTELVSSLRLHIQFDQSQVEELLHNLKLDPIFRISLGLDSQTFVTLLPSLEEMEEYRLLVRKTTHFCVENHLSGCIPVAYVEKVLEILNPHFVPQGLRDFLKKCSEFSLSEVGGELHVTFK